MLSNMACSLIEHKRINTTVAKAKALRVFIEPIITKSKEDSTHNRRIVFSTLQSKEAVTELFREVAPKIMSRPGGYTRIIKTGFRQGDGAETAMIELVDFNELYGKETQSKSKRRRRGGSKSTSAEGTTATSATEEVVEEVVSPAETEIENVKEETNAKAEEAQTPTEESPKAEADSPANDDVEASDSEEEKKD